MRCSVCGFSNPEGMRFCGNCGTALHGAAAEERKLVTVLFADVVGSTSLAAGVDPEHLRGTMARFFEIARAEIERYGGTVEKYIGDAVMAVFGLPRIHEDDAERAVRAAAAIQAQVTAAPDLPPIRIGLYTGEVVANPRAADKGEFLVTGEAVNLAARLQQHAAAGQILLGERTLFSLRGIAHAQSVGPIEVRGAPEPVQAWALLQVRPPRERDLRPTPFVGREEELNLLRGHVRRMKREGRGHMVTVLGPAGVGKTRLAREFRDRNPDVRALRGRALPYGTGVPFWALGEVLREECGVLMDDPLDAARRKVEERAGRLEVADAVPALLAVLGLGTEGLDLSRDALFGGLRAFVLALASRHPLVVVLEDLHAAEDVTLDFVEHMADWIRDAALVVLVLSRPELLERRPTWMGGKRSATTLVLDPLGGEDSRELAAAVLGGKAAPRPLLDLVLRRAEGNPLFMEEMLRGLVERHVLREDAERWTLTVPLDEVVLPDTVRAVIAARVDALEPLEKQVIQSAAVVGKDFWLGALAFIRGENHVDEAVESLVGKDLLIPKRRSALTGEVEYTFRHILIRDVAYAMIPKAQRWPMHARLAQWLRQISGDRWGEVADFIAHHWLHVLSLQDELGLPADPRARDEAITSLLVAGDRAAQVYANTTALDHYGRAVELEPEPPRRARALRARGNVWMLLGQYERARDDFADARALAASRGDRRAEATALDLIGHSYRRQDRAAEALEQLTAALAISGEVNDPALRGRILNHVGFTYFGSGRHAEAIRTHEEALALLEACGDIAGIAESLHGVGENLFFSGRYRDALPWFERSVEASERVHDRALAAENLYMIGFARHMLADYARAHDAAARSITALTEIGDVWNLSAALFNTATLATTAGEFGSALEHATRGAALARQIGATRFAVYNTLVVGSVHRQLEDPHGALAADAEAAALAHSVGGTWVPWILASLALDSAELGRLGDAEEHLREARRVLGTTETRMAFRQEVTHAECHVHLAAGRLAEARDAAVRLGEVAREMDTPHWELPALLLRAQAEAALGERPAFGEVAHAAEEVGRLPIVWRAQAGLAEALWREGHADEARAAAGRARDVVERLAASVPDERLRATFLQSAAVQRVIALA